MKKIEVPFLLARNKEIVNGHELIISAKFPHIIGVVYTFGNRGKSEGSRLILIDRYADRMNYIAKAVGYRCYVRFYSALSGAVTCSEDEIKRTMEEMSDWYVRCSMTDGERKTFADVPDDKLPTPIFPDWFEGFGTGNYPAEDD